MRPRGSCGCSARSRGSAETRHASRSSASRPAARSSPLLSRPDTAAIPVAAIIQSGPLEAVAPERAGRVTRALAKDLGIAATREAFAAASPRALLDARRRLAEGSNPLSGTPGYALAVDPETLPVSPDIALQTVDIPLVIGTNTDEYRLWFTPEALAGITELKLLLARLMLRIPQRAMAAYRVAWPGATTGELFGQIATDILVRAPATRVALARNAPTFMYEFAWESPVRELRAAHAVEIGFVFDGLRTGAWQSLLGADPPQNLATEMHDAWVSFIHTGKPGWVPYGAGRAVQVFDTRSAAVPQRRTTPMDLLR
jgi:para-nitrobenzyl esterase